jgi:hypothetical protein
MTGHDAFHAHLDFCAQCEQNPFELCPEGQRLLQAAVVDAGRKSMLRQALGIPQEEGHEPE